MPVVLVMVPVGVTDAVGVLVGDGLTLEVAVGVNVLVGVTVAVVVIVSVTSVVVKRPLHVMGLMLPGKPPAGTGNATPVRNTRFVLVSGTVVTQ